MQNNVHKKAKNNSEANSVKQDSVPIYSAKWEKYRKGMCEPYSTI